MILFIQHKHDILFENVHRLIINGICISFAQKIIREERGILKHKEVKFYTKINYNHLN